MLWADRGKELQVVREEQFPGIKVNDGELLRPLSAAVQGAKKHLRVF